MLQLDPTAEDKQQFRRALLTSLARQTDGHSAAYTVGKLVRLDPTAEDRRQAREELLRLVMTMTFGWNASGVARGCSRLTRRRKTSASSDMRCWSC